MQNNERITAQQHTATTELQAADFRQAHTLCGKVKLVYWGQPSPILGATASNKNKLNKTLNDNKATINKY